jgi:membrane protease YdiL (CAAX protease family)
MRSPQRRSLHFVLLTLALSAVPYAVMISAGTMMVDGGSWVLAVMWCPGIAGMALQLIERRTLRGLGWGWGSTRHQAYAYLLPLAYAGAAYAIVWMTGLGSFPETSRIVRGLEAFGFDASMSSASAAVLWLGIVGTFGFLQGCVSATGEEIGWRGYLVPHLAEAFGPTKATLITGMVWALWHFPAIFLLDYHGATPSWYSASMFFVMVLGISFAFTWLRLASGSLWSGAFLHASHNAFIQGYFDRVTGDTGATAWFIGEFGLALAVTGGLTGFLVWRSTMRATSRSIPSAVPSA